MAINPSTQYPGKIASDPTNYPYGKARNVTTSGDGTGTPWEAALVNDLFGMQQRLLALAGITPSGTPESAVTSQYFEAMWALGNQRSVTHDMASDADYTLTADQNLYGRVVITDTGVLLTAARNIVVDGVERQVLVQNLTLQTLTFKTSGGTGVAVPPGGFRILRNDGTNVIEVGPHTGRKNLIINGNKIIQQRGTTGGRRQVIDAENVTESGDFTVSYTDTATVRVYEATTLGATDATTTWSELTGGASNSGVVVAFTAGKYVKIEFSSTSFNNVQVERGRFASEFEQVDDLELSKCQRYFLSIERLRLTGQCTSTTTVNGAFLLPSSMRATPTVDFNGVTNYTVSASGGGTTATTNMQAVNLTPQSMNIVATVGSAVLVAGNASNIVGGSGIFTYLNAEHFTDTYYEDRWY